MAGGSFYYEFRRLIGMEVDFGSRDGLSALACIVMYASSHVSMQVTRADYGVQIQTCDVTCWLQSIRDKYLEGDMFVQLDT